MRRGRYACRLFEPVPRSPVLQPRRVTLKDVAREAGVSTGTVSMVLNDSPRIAAATREHVREVMRTLGYVYDRSAGNLRNRTKSRIVGVSICDLVNPYYADVLAGIQETVDKLGRVPVLGNCAESVPRQLRFLETLREYNVEGLIVTPVIGTPKADLQQVVDWRLPVVQVTRLVTGVDTDYVGINNRMSAQIAVAHLAALGHQRIAYIGHTRRTTTGRDRLAGFNAGLKAARLVADAELFAESHVTREGGAQAVAQLFGHRRRPTALVCFNDVIAFGAMLGLRQLGLEPGRDCAVVGLDNVTEAALWKPALTSVAVDADRIGQEAGRLLMRRLESPDLPTERVVLDPHLVVRESCGSAR